MSQEDFDNVTEFVEVIGQVSDDKTPTMGAMRIFPLGMNFDLLAYSKMIEMSRTPLFHDLFPIPQ